MKQSKLSRFIAYYKPHKLLFFLDMTCSLLVALTGMGYPIITRILINDLIPNGKNNLILITSLVLLGVYILRACFRYFINYYGHVMGVAMQAQMRKDMFNKLEKLPYSYFDNHETGKIMSRMTNDLFDVSELAHHGPENIFIASFTILGAFTYLMIINWMLGLITFAMVPILFGISLFFRKRMLNAFKETRVAQASINGALESSITGIRVTKAYTNEEKELEKFEVSNKEFVKARTKAFSALAGYMTSSSFITDLFNIIIILGGGLFMYAGNINVADFTTFVISISLFINPVNQLIQFMEQYQSASSGFTRFLEVLDEKEEIDDGEKVLNNVQGYIEFKDVKFGYNDKEILHGISFKLESGKTYSFVGKSGSGKSTIFNLITKMYDVDNDSIFIENVDINELSRDSLRDSIAIITQSPYIFNFTIRENLMLVRSGITDEEMKEACKTACIHDFIMNLPDGYDSKIGEGGTMLSGGERQRLAIARALLKGSNIILFDEATSALDNVTQEHIQDAINNLKGDHTILIIAHRLSTVIDSDKIFMIDDGNIICSGSHKYLLDNYDDYKNLYKKEMSKE